MDYDIDTNTYRIEGEIHYDAVNGELIEVTRDLVRNIVHVRRALEDQMLLQAVILELEKRGYTVISPEVGE